MCCSNLFKNDKSVAASKALGDILGPWGSNPLRALGFVCVESWLKTSKWINDDTLIRIWKKFIEIISVQSPKKHFGGPLLVMQEGRVTVLKFEDPILHLSQGVSPVETQSDTGLPKEDCTPLLMFFLVIPSFPSFALGLRISSTEGYWAVGHGQALATSRNSKTYDAQAHLYVLTPVLIILHVASWIEIPQSQALWHLLRLILSRCSSHQ